MFIKYEDVFVLVEHSDLKQCATALYVCHSEDRNVLTSPENLRIKIKASHVGC